MPTVRNHEGDVHVRGYGRYAGGQDHEVSRDAAEYLTSNRDFTLIKGDVAPEPKATDDDTEPAVTVSDPDEDETLGEDTDAEPESVSEPVDATPETVEEAMDAGECPWCDEYEGDAVGRHASSKHPDAWEAYKTAREE